jgi:hypothetical protein
MTRAQADQLAVLIRRQAVRTEQVGRGERAIPAAAQMALHALLLRINLQLASHRVQRRAIESAVHVTERAHRAKSTAASVHRAEEPVASEPPSTSPSKEHLERIYARGSLGAATAAGPAGPHGT